MMSGQHPDPWVLALVRELAADPVISLERRDEPTHALVRTVYAGCGDEAIVEVDLIDSPPTPTAPTFGGFFEERAFERPSESPERPWFVFHRWLTVAQNIARLRVSVRDCVFHTGRREAPPACVDDIPDAMDAPRSSYDAMPSASHLAATQQRPSQPPPGKALPSPPMRSPSSQRSPSPSSQRVPHRAPPRRHAAPPEPPPPAPAFTGEAPPGLHAPPSRPPASQPPPPSQPLPPRKRASSIPPPPRRNVPSGPIPPPPPIPMALGGPPSSGPTSGLPPPPPPPPPPPFGEEEV